jgi:hypothetical protein
MKTSFWLIIFLLAAVKLTLMQSIPVSAIAYNIHDDTLFINQAGGFGLWLSDFLNQNGTLLDFNIDSTKGGWLGRYNEFILCKGPVYAIWIASCLLAGIPLLTAQYTLYIIAGIMIIIGLKQEIPFRPLLLFLFAAFLFNPEFVSRILRAGIYPALSVLVLAGLFGIYSNRHRSWIIFGCWTLFLGCILPFFWMTREEGIWLVPSISLTLLATLISLYSRQGFCRQFFLKTFLTSVPLLLLFGAIQAVSCLNGHFYGIRCVVELKSDTFSSAYGALLRVTDTSDPTPFVVVSSSARKKIYEISPSFKEIEPFLEGERGKMWQQFGCQIYPETCGEIAAGWFLWAFRDAVALAGHHNSGQEASKYYEQLAKEINTACSEETLTCLPERNALMPPPSLNDYVKTLQNIPAGLSYVLHFENLLERLNQQFYSLGEEETLRHYQDMTNEQVAPSRDGRYQSSPPLPIQTMLNTIKRTILKKIAGIYITTTAVLFSFALFFYLLSLLFSFRKKQFHSLTLFSTVLILGISSRLFILSFIDVTSFPGYNHAYLSPLYSFVILFICFSYIDFFQLIFQQRLAHRKSANNDTTSVTHNK